jgi:hypothetical protein
MKAKKKNVDLAIGTEHKFLHTHTQTQAARHLLIVVLEVELLMSLSIHVMYFLVL